MAKKLTFARNIIGSEILVYCRYTILKAKYGRNSAKIPDNF